MDNIVIDSYRLVDAYELVDAYGLVFIAYRLVNILLIINNNYYKLLN
jgi:hypothetical protein